MSALPRRALLALMSAALCASGAEATVLLTESFDEPLDASVWTPVRVRTSRSEVLEARNGALEIGMDTIDTDDETVKVLGIRTTLPITTPSGLRVSATLDWNEQANGCYLTQGFLLAQPEELAKQLAAGGDPRRTPGATGFEQIGVPPGRNVRPFLWRFSGGLEALFTEGWPQARVAERRGRPPRRACFTLELTRERVSLREDCTQLFEGRSAGLPAEQALMFFVTSHSNYPLRVVRFHDIRVEAPDR